MIRQGRDETRDFELKCDLCVVGSGAGGAMVAREAARAGLSVVVLEEGAYLQPKQFTQREDEMIPLLFQEAGGRATHDGSIMVLQGRGFGGSTVHNTNLCKRAPSEVLDSWRLPGWGAADLAPHYEVVERDLHVSPIDEAQVNRNSALLRRGVEKLGWKGGLLSHNRRGCVGSGFCDLGCTFDAKENAAKILLPEAIASNATVLTDCRADRILLDGARAVGVSARIVNRAGDHAGHRASDAEVRVTIFGAVCLSASAIGSAALALRSGLGERVPATGASLHLHPGLAVAGVFDEVIEGWQGIPQSYECTQHLRFDEGAGDERIWIIPAFAHPASLASMLPGFGAAHAARMRDYPKMGILAALLHDRSSGSVSLESDGRARIRYQLDADDQRTLLSGARACAEILLAAGAKRVLVPFADPLEISNRSELDAIVQRGYRPLDPVLTSTHPMGTLPLGKVVDEQGRFHTVSHLWVTDGSVFPSSLGGPPQLTIYAAAHKIAHHLIAELGK